MNGLLWFDDNKNHSTAEKIRRACHRYKQKFGIAPNTVKVKVGTAAGVTIKGVRIIQDIATLQDCFLVGVTE